MNLSEMYKRIAAEIRKNPDRWIQHYEALSMDGFTVNPYSTMATRWCLMGFFEREVGNGDYMVVDADLLEIRQRIFRTMERVLGTPYITTWNDKPGRTVDDVINVLERAGEEGEEEDY